MTSGWVMPEVTFRKHKKLHPVNDKPQFWDFSWHEIGVYDLPALIDYILQNTAKPDLIYMGHSQGTTSFFVMGSERSEFLSKVRVAVMMAPSVFLQYCTHPLLRAVSPNYKMWIDLVNRLNEHEFVPFVDNEALRFLMNYFCAKPGVIQDIYMTVLYISLGFMPEQIDQRTIPMISMNTPAGCSARQMLHYAQIIATGEFKQFDFNIMENMKRYNTSAPPKYNLSNVKAPVGLFYAKNDYFNNVKAVQTLAQHLPNVAKMYLVPIKEYSHFDFIVAKNSVNHVYAEVVRFINNYHYDSNSTNNTSL